MTWPLLLPDWLPWWAPIFILVPTLLYGLVFLLMPFSVIGLKGKLDAIEARLDEVQAELRQVSYYLAEPWRSEENRNAVGNPADSPRRDRSTFAIARSRSPSAEDYPKTGKSSPEEFASSPTLQRPARDDGARGEAGRRAEPRLDWPR